MIEFATLFLGLYVGVVPVEVLVGDEVSSVEMRLDGEWVGTLGGPPWVAPCDLGEELVPHELIAIARDPEGREVGRARQWINVPRPAAEARVVVREAAVPGSWIADVSWNSATGGVPEEVTATLDGEPVPVTDPTRIVVHPRDPGELHFLRVDLRFPSGLAASAEAAFGGEHGTSLETDVTAVPLWFEGRSPSVGALRGRLAAGGSALEVVGLDEGPGELLLVPDLASRERLLALGPSGRQSVRAEDRWIGVVGANARFAGAFPRDLRLRILWPVVELRPRTAGHRSLLRPSPEMSPWDAGLLPHLRSFPPPAAGAVQRIADAVAAAGLLAAERGRRRAVVLVLSGEGDDASHLSPARARGFLERLGVPLFVWDVTGELGETGWGPAERVDSLRRLERALDRVGEILARQRIAWVAGAVLPGTWEIHGGSPPSKVGSVPFDEGLEPILGDEEDSPRSAASVALRTSAPPVLDPARIERALAAMTEPVTRARLGPFDLHTDLRRPDRVLALAPVAAVLESVYRERYGLEPAAGERETLVLYAEEASYRSWAGDEAPAGEDIAGHAGGGLAVVLVGDRGDEQVRALLVHELVHLLNRRSFATAPMPWLEEGLAEALATHRFDEEGRPLDRSWWGGRSLDARGSGSGRIEATVSRNGSLGALHDLADRAQRGGLVPLGDLLDLEADSFLERAGRQLRYGQSALFVRFLLEGDRGRRATAFRGFVRSAAAGGSSGADALEIALGEPLASTEAAFRAWLRFQDAASGL